MFRRSGSVALSASFLPMVSFAFPLLPSVYWTTLHSEAYRSLRCLAFCVYAIVVVLSVWLTRKSCKRWPDAWHNDFLVGFFSFVLIFWEILRAFCWFVCRKCEQEKNAHYVAAQGLMLRLAWGRYLFYYLGMFCFVLMSFFLASLVSADVGEWELGRTLFVLWNLGLLFCNVFLTIWVRAGDTKLYSQLENKPLFVSVYSFQILQQTDMKKQEGQDLLRELSHGVFLIYLIFILQFGAVYYTMSSDEFCVTHTLEKRHTHTLVPSWMNFTFFSMISAATVGYGDITPIGYLSQIAVFLQVLASVFVFATYSGIVIALIRERPAKPDNAASSS